MNKKIKIVPTLLTYSLKEFKEKLKKVEKDFKLVQIDFMDNKFVSNRTFYDLNKIRKIKTPVDYELHLMVNNPFFLIKKWVGFKKVKKIFVHFESAKSKQELYDIIKYIKSKKIKVGIAINPETSLNKIEEFLPQIDILVIMGVKPGWGGQKLKTSVLNKAKKARNKYPRLDIEIDGGVNIKNIAKIVRSGVNIISAGTMIFEAVDLKRLINEIKNKYDEE